MQTHVMPGPVHKTMTIFRNMEDSKRSQDDDGLTTENTASSSGVESGVDERQILVNILSTLNREDMPPVAIIIGVHQKLL